MRKTVLVVLADGFEEIEAITPIDVLRRAGLEVIVAGVGKREVPGAHGVTIETDIILEQYQGAPDAVVLPGGMPGAANLQKSQAVNDVIRKVAKAGKLIGAICASPAVVLAPAGILEGKRATCYPGFEDEFGSKVVFTEERVVRDGQVITSRGPGSALEFSIELVRHLVNEDAAKKLAQAMVAKD